MRVRLTRLNNAGNALRTGVVTGDLVSLLAVGFPLVIEAEPLQAGFNFRQVTTSPVVRIRDVGGRMEVQTENTLYQLEVLEVSEGEDESGYWEEKAWREERDERWLKGEGDV